MKPFKKVCAQAEQTISPRVPMSCRASMNALQRPSKGQQPCSHLATPTQTCDPALIRQQRRRRGDARSAQDIPPRCAASSSTACLTVVIMSRHDRPPRNNPKTESAFGSFRTEKARVEGETSVCHAVCVWWICVVKVCDRCRSKRRLSFGEGGKPISRIICFHQLGIGRTPCYAKKLVFPSPPSCNESVNF